MNGIEESSKIVFVRTNRPDILEPAVVRDKRLDENLVVSRPNRKAVEGIFRKELKKYPLAEDLETFVQLAAEAFYSDGYKIYEVAKGKEDKIEEVLTFKLSDLVNGAMIVGIVERAVKVAVARDIQNGAETDPTKLSSLTREDIKASVAETYRQKFGLKHTEELQEFVADFKDQIVGIRKVHLIQKPQ